MRVNEGHGACDDPERNEKAVFLFEESAVQKIETGEQQSPPEQGGALRDQHVRDGIDPFDPDVHVVGRSLVERGKNTGKVSGIFLQQIKKINKSEPASDKKQKRAERGLGIVAVHPLFEKQINAGQNEQEREDRREDRGETERSAERIKRGADAVRKEGVADSCVGAD